MPSNQVSRLCKWTLDVAINEHTRSPKGSDKKDVFGIGKDVTLKEGYQADANKCTHKGPKMFSAINKCFFI